MESKESPASLVDAYIAGFPPAVQERLAAIRTAIHEAVPEAEERISYQMPAFDDKGILIYFAAFKDHISIFPTADGVEAFKDELAAYRSSKGTIHLPFGQPLPLELIARIARYRAEANRRAEAERQQKKDAARAAAGQAVKRTRK